MGYGGSGRKTTVPGFQELLTQDLKRNEFRPVYVLAGDDALRKEGVIQKIRKEALGGAGAFNDHAFDGETCDPAKVFQQVLSLPMMGGRQLVLVKHADKFLDNQASLLHFERYLEKPVPETIFILTMTKADRRKTWVKTALKAGYFFEFANPTGAGLVQWILKAAKRLDLELDADKAGLLADLLGDDLMSIKNELDKIALMQADRGRSFSGQDIRDLVMDQAELQGYEITEHLMPGSAARMLGTWFRLAEWGRSPYEVSPVVLSRIRRAYLLEFAREEGLDDASIGKLTGQNPWSFRYLGSLLANMGPAGLVRAQETALACDRRLKGSPLEPGAVFEQAILELCRKA